MKGIRLIDTTCGLCAQLLLPVAAAAQVTGSAQAPLPPSAGPLPEGRGTAIAAVAIGVVLLAILVAAIKAYDLKKKRDEVAMALGARVSDELLVEPSLRGCPIVAT